MEYMGSHIAALLLRFFVMYFPFMIEAGKVYKAIPPLYSIKQGKKTKYFTEQIDIVKYVQKFFLDNNSLDDVKGNNINPKDITIFLLRNADYTYYLEKVANTYAVDPYLLEMVLYHWINNNESVNLSKLQKEVSSVYRFMSAEKQGNTVVVKGSIDKSNLIIINDKFLSDCVTIMDLIKSNESIYYNLNKKKSSIYQIMKVYETNMPSVQRYKGLGEMDEDELAESTLYPGSDRTLVRYTMDSAREAIDTIRSYESDTKKILSLVSNVTRDDLLD